MNKSLCSRPRFLIGLLSCLLILPGAAKAEEPGFSAAAGGGGAAAEMARKLQNPLANIKALMTDNAMQSAVSAIVKAAGKRGIKTIAERVENANAMAVLFQLGLDFMQGHYVHEPEVVLQDTDSGVTNTLDDLTAANAN